MKTLLTTTAFILAASAASAENICYRQMNPLDYQCRYDPAENRCDCRQIRHGEDKDRPKQSTQPEEPGGHWATRDNEPNSRTDPEGHRDWQRDRDAQRAEGTW